ncbi:hypothetical protein BH09VER1_BH09VER1_16410 [soil metagenome]
MGKLFSRKFIVGAIVVAVICGVLRSFWMFGELPAQAVLLSAAQGNGTDAWLWRTGGAELLQAGQALKVGLWGAGVALVVLLLVGAAARIWRAFLIGLTILILLGLSVLPFIKGWKFQKDRISDLRLIAPVELAAKAGKLKKEEVFTNAEAAAWLPLFAPGIAGGTSQEDYALVGSPKAWRDALRKSQWKAVLLTGPATNFKPLLDHLITSPDWTLSVINNHGYFFERGAGTPPAEFEPKAFRLANNQETAIYLGQVAMYYDAIHRNTEARGCIEQALKLAPKNALVLSYAATYAAAHRRWQDAMDLAQKALNADPNYLQAKVVKAMALLELGEAERARQEVEAVLAVAPDDFYTLFIFARICRAENDFTREAATLEHIVELCGKNGFPKGNYQLYLGQAYARLGMAKPALLNYRAALESGLLDQKQSDEVKDAIKTIESRDKP